MDVREVVASTSEPAFAEDLEGSIVAWNDAAEEFLGYRRSEVVGRKCWEVLGGRDVYGNRYCGENCPLRDHAFLGEPIHTALMSFRAAGGTQIRVSNSCMLLTNRVHSRTSLLHLLSPAEPLGGKPAEAAARKQNERSRAGLSNRQHEILQLLAEGRGTREIAERLGISVATTRNHIQGILAKLKVHNRLAATILARRIGLV